MCALPFTVILIVQTATKLVLLHRRPYDLNTPKKRAYINAIKPVRILEENTECSCGCKSVAGIFNGVNSITDAKKLLYQKQSIQISARDVSTRRHR